MNINLPKNLDSCFDITTSGEELEKSSQRTNKYILSDYMKVNEEYFDRRSNCSNYTTSLNFEIWNENKLTEENKGDDVSTTVTNVLFGISLVKHIGY